MMRVKSAGRLSSALAATLILASVLTVAQVIVPEPVAADPLPLGLGPCIDTSGSTGCTSGDTNINTFVGGDVTFGGGWSRTRQRNPEHSRDRGMP
jgi:hypothetical protein